MNETQEGIALMYLQARVNRRKQITSAFRAANYLSNEGVLIEPPTGISKSRWRAMIVYVINNGEPV